MDKSQAKHTEASSKKRSKKLIRLFVILAAFAVAIVLVSVGVVYFLNNYVFFPRADKALANVLESKFDLGTKFDIRDMVKQGKIELVAEGIEDVDRLEATVAYGKKGVSASLASDGEELSAVLTRKGIAAGSEKFRDGEYYGISFLDLFDNLDGSFLNPENDSEYALAEKKYESLKSLVSKLEDIADGKGKNAKDAAVMLETVKTAFDKSPLYNKVKSYDDVEIGGNLRAARSIAYTFDHASVKGFLEALADTFEEPSAELEDAVSRLIEGGVLTEAIEDYLGVTLESCEDIAELIDDLARLMDVFLGKSDWHGRLILAYVNDAFSAIELSVELKQRSFYVLVDFGENPKSDKNMSFTVIDEKLDSKQSLIKKVEHVASYSVEEQGRQTVIFASYRSATTGKDEGCFEQSYEANALLDRDNDIATLKVDKYETVNGAEVHSSICDLGFDMTDGNSTFILATDDALSAEKYTLTLKKRAGAVKLPKYQDVLEMDVQDADALISEFKESAEWILHIVGFFDTDE